MINQRAQKTCIIVWNDILKIKKQPKSTLKRQDHSINDAGIPATAKSCDILLPHDAGVT